MTNTVLRSTLLVCGINVALRVQYTVHCTGATRTMYSEYYVVQVVEKQCQILEYYSTWYDSMTV